MSKNLLFAVTANKEYPYTFDIYDDGSIVVSMRSSTKEYHLLSGTVKKLRSQMKKVQKRLKNIPEQLIGRKDGLCIYISQISFGDKAFHIDNISNMSNEMNEDYRRVIKECLDIILLIEKYEPIVINDTGVYILDHSQDINLQIQATRQQMLVEIDESIKYSLATFLMTILHWCNHKVYYLVGDGAPAHEDHHYIFCLFEDVSENGTYGSMPFNDYMCLLMKTSTESKAKYQHADYYWSTDAIRDCILANKTM